MVTLERLNEIAKQVAQNMLSDIKRKERKAFAEQVGRQLNFRKGLKGEVLR